MPPCVPSRGASGHGRGDRRFGARLERGVHRVEPRPRVLVEAAGEQHAQQETPFCWCGAPAVAVDRDGVIWLGCSSRNRPSRLVRRLLTLDSGHIQRPILDLSELNAAA